MTMLVPNKKYLYYAKEFTTHIADIVIISNYHQYLDARNRRQHIIREKKLNEGKPFGSKVFFMMGADDWPSCHK